MTADLATALDATYMRRALRLAERGWGQTAPNPMVGAVVVAGDVVAGEGWHERFGEAHAEVNALRAAGDRARGATMYVSLEPCNHHGKTPPCTDAVLAAGIARVVVAVPDPSAIARGGIARLRASGLQVDVGVEREPALELNAPFFNAHASDRPWVTLKLAVSADGAVADPSGRERWITGPVARAHVHALRANADAIAVGIGTVLADDPLLTVRDAPAPRVPPKRVIFDRHLRLPPGSRLVQTAREIPTRVFTLGTRGDERARESLIQAGVSVDESALGLDGVLRVLRADGVRSLFVECGPRLAGALLAASLVDRLTIFRSALVLGPSAPRALEFAPPGFEQSLDGVPVVERREFDGDLMITYALTQVPCSPA